MKTAKELAEAIKISLEMFHPIVDPATPGNSTLLEDMIKEIQLDSWKQGMADAAKRPQLSFEPKGQRN